MQDGSEAFDLEVSQDLDIFVRLLLYGGAFVHRDFILFVHFNLFNNSICCSFFIVVGLLYCSLMTLKLLMLCNFLLSLLLIGLVPFIQSCLCLIVNIEIRTPTCKLDRECDEFLDPHSDVVWDKISDFSGAAPLCFFTLPSAVLF